MIYGDWGSWLAMRNVQMIVHAAFSKAATLPNLLCGHGCLLRHFIKGICGASRKGLAGPGPNGIKITDLRYGLQMRLIPKV
jgi:hypothetical protein